jgi:hypothetical protein
VTNILPVLTSLLESTWACLSISTLQLWIVVKISLGLDISESLGTSTESTLLDTNGGVVRLWIQESINILIP